MSDIRTYPVGNGEITLSVQDAEELRVLLQTDYLTKVISELIDDQGDALHFPSRSARRHFIDECVSLNRDLVDYDSSYYAEMLIENIFDRAALYNFAR